MRLCSRCSPLVLALALCAAAAHAAAPPLSQLQVVDPVQRALVDKLFTVAQGPELARNLLPGQPDVRLAYFQVLVMPLPNGAPGPILGFPISGNGVLQATATTLGQTQGSGTTGVAEGSGTLYLAESTSNNLAGYSVDIGSGLLSNAPGAPFAADAEPSSVVIEPGGRFLYAASQSAQVVDIFSINLANASLTGLGTQPTSLSQPSKINATRQCVFVASASSGGYEAFKINPSTGALASVPGSPFGTHTAGSIAHTPDGNFVFFATNSPASEIDGFFVDPSTCALSTVPGSSFTGPADAVLRASPTLDVLYAAGGGELQAFAINPASGALRALGSSIAIDSDTGAMAIGPKGEHLWVADHSNRNLRSFALDPVTGAPSAVGTPVLGPSNVESMAVEALNGAAQVGQGVAQNRTSRSIGGAPPYTFAAAAGTLPAGLHMDSSGKITGTATTLGQSVFQLRITDAVGATATATRVFKVVPAPAAPAAPSNATATVTATQATVSWQDNTGHTAASRVEMSQDGGPFVGVVTVNKLATSAVVTGLSPATLYKFRVVATNPGGASSPSNTVAVSTPGIRGTVCAPDDFTQCLLGLRFRLQAIYQDAQGDAGLAHVVPITSDTAYLWFFSPSNVEAVVKLVNGCGLGGHYWVFAGGLTNVHVILRVTDTQTGAVRDYEVPYGQPFTPIQDTSAFGTCSTVATASTPTDLTAKALQERASAEVAARLAAASRDSLTMSAAADLAAPLSTCIASSTALCLNNGRFRVTATFDAGSAGSGAAHVGSLTSDTGYLWFFSSANVEAVVKVLDGCSLGGHYWVFAGGLTNVQVTITVTDTLTSEVKQYTNASGTVFQPIQDTAAFAGCQ